MNKVNRETSYFKYSQLSNNNYYLNGLAFTAQTTKNCMNAFEIQLNWKQQQQ